MGNEDPVPETGNKLEADREPVRNPGEELKSLATRFLPLHFRFSGIFGADKTGRKSGQAELPPVSISFRILIAFLKTTPWICTALFILSYFWDLDHVQPMQVMGQEVNFNGLIRILSVSGLIGYATNLIAIRMLFKPVTRRPIFGQGLIPAQRDRLIDQIAKGIHENILSQELIRKRIEASGMIGRINEVFIKGTHGLLKDEDFKAELREIVDHHLRQYFSREDVKEVLLGEIDSRIEENLNRGFKGFLFRTYKRINRSEYEAFRENLVGSIPSLVAEGMDALDRNSDSLVSWLRERQGSMEEFLTKLVHDLLASIDIRELLFRQMEHFDEQKLEKMIWNATNEQLLYIQLLGTVLGVLGGLLIWQPVLMAVFLGGMFGLLLLLDIIIYNLQKK